MEENTHLGSLISNLENDKLANDANAKEVLADKEILSRILKGTMREFDTTELDAVKNSIAPEVVISDVMVNPGVSNKEKVKIIPLISLLVFILQGAIGSVFYLYTEIIRPMAPSCKYYARLNTV